MNNFNHRKTDKVILVDLKGDDFKPSAKLLVLTVAGFVLAFGLASVYLFALAQKVFA